MESSAVDLTRIGSRAGGVVLVGVHAAPFADDVLGGGPNRAAPGAFYPAEHFEPAGGADKVFGGRGPDIIFLKRDGRPDFVDCGAGKDYVAYPYAKDAHDVFLKCESVRKQVTKRALLSR
jgi:hypothetical protein